MNVSPLLKLKVKAGKELMHKRTIDKEVWEHELLYFDFDGVAGRIRFVSEFVYDILAGPRMAHVKHFSKVQYIAPTSDAWTITERVKDNDLHSAFMKVLDRAHLTPVFNVEM